MFDTFYTRMVSYGALLVALVLCCGGGCASRRTAAGAAHRPAGGPGTARGRRSEPRAAGSRRRRFSGDQRPHAADGRASVVCVLGLAFGMVIFIAAARTCPCTGRCSRSRS